MTAPASTGIATGSVSAASRAFGRFFLPGPTEVRARVLEAMAQPMIGHRGKGMEALIARIQPGLRYVFRTTRPVYIASSSATGLMEGAVRNGVRPRVLSLVNGAFSERFFQIAQSCGSRRKRSTSAGAVRTRRELLADALKRGRFDAVTVVHSETSTGALNPDRGARACRARRGRRDAARRQRERHGGQRGRDGRVGARLRADGSQKAFALPPGLAFGVARDTCSSARRRSATAASTSTSSSSRSTSRKNQTPNTPALSLLYALAAQLAYIREETIEGRWARHAAMAAAHVGMGR